MKPLTPTEVSEIISTVQEAQDATRATLARFLRIQGYPVASVSSPSSHILERLATLREQEAEMFRTILEGDAEQRRQRDYNLKRQQQRAAAAGAG
jgi:uncharacterized protein with PIN domain